MAKLTKLPTPEKIKNPDVVRLLKEMLVKAEAGEVDGFAMSVSYPDSAEHGRGTFGTLFTGNPNQDLLGFLGSLRVLEERVLQHVEIPERDGVDE